MVDWVCTASSLGKAGRGEACGSLAAGTEFLISGNAAGQPLLLLADGATITESRLIHDGVFVTGSLITGFASPEKARFIVLKGVRRDEGTRVTLRVVR